MPSRGADFELLIVGGGSAGFAAAIKGAELGARVALVEGGTLGGTCVNVGCVPSKTLIRAAEVQHRRSHHPFHGIPAGDGRPDWAPVRGQKDQLVGELRQAKYWDVLRSYQAVTDLDLPPLSDPVRRGQARRADLRQGRGEAVVLRSVAAGLSRCAGSTGLLTRRQDFIKLGALRESRPVASLVSLIEGRPEAARWRDFAFLDPKADEGRRQGVTRAP